MRTLDTLIVALHRAGCKRTMSKEPPKPLALAARAQIEAKRAEYEIWFNEAVTDCKTQKDFDETLMGYVFGVFIACAQALLNSGFESNWPVAEIRERIELALSGVIDEAFASKHYYGQG